MKKIFNQYTNKLINLISENYLKELSMSYKLINTFKKSKNKIIFIGNGGSSAISSHISVDLSKQTNIRATNFNEADLITCFANDYGHDNWMKEALKVHCDKNDLVILISSSGYSKNIINAAKWCLNSGVQLITLTGNTKNKKSLNPIFKLNKSGINFFVNSNIYNHIEITHLFILMFLVDQLGKKSV